jgi:hypothetical protein
MSIWKHLCEIKMRHDPRQWGPLSARSHLSSVPVFGQTASALKLGAPGIQVRLTGVNAAVAIGLLVAIGDISRKSVG